jgi:type VI secretion system protein VasD
MNLMTLFRIPKHARAIPAVLLSFALSACGAFSGSGTPAAKEPARLDIEIHAGSDLNTDAKGRGAPMLLRVYELKSEAAFAEADFFALQKSDKALLGADLLAVDQFVVRPGETRRIRRKSHPETTVIGVFAAYNDLPHAVWRTVHKMPSAPEAVWYRAVVPSYKATLRIDLQAKAILLTDQDAGERPTRYTQEDAALLQSQEPLEALEPLGGLEPLDPVKSMDPVKAFEPPKSSGALKGAKRLP